MHSSFHDEAQARLAGHSEMDVKEAQGPKPKVTWRLLVKTVRYINGSKDLATFMPRSGNADSIEAHFNGDWTCDDIDRKSASCG